ncbi:hypothetical protein V8C37DRAFT_90039 [Trichoderma ceciliae]
MCLAAASSCVLRILNSFLLLFCIMACGFQYHSDNATSDQNCLFLHVLPVFSVLITITTKCPVSCSLLV